MVGMDADVEDACKMTLNNGAKMPLSTFFEVCSSLENLRVKRYEHFLALVKKAHDKTYEIENKEIATRLIKKNLLLSDGTINQASCDVILSGVNDEGDTFMLYDPSIPLTQKSRSLFGHAIVPTAAQE